MSMSKRSRISRRDRRSQSEAGVHIATLQEAAVIQTNPVENSVTPGNPDEDWPTVSEAELRASRMEAYKAYLDERKGLNDAELAACENFDKYMITLSSGALGLSLLYLEKVAKQPIPTSYPWLYWSWSLLGVTLCIMLVSFLCSQSSWRRQREILDYNQYQQLGMSPPASTKPWLASCFIEWLQSDGRIPSIVRYCLGENCWSKLTKWLNVAALLLFFWRHFRISAIQRLKPSPSGVNHGSRNYGEELGIKRTTYKGFASASCAGPLPN